MSIMIMQCRAWNIVQSSSKQVIQYFPIYRLYVQKILCPVTMQKSTKIGATRIPMHVQSKIATWFRVVVPKESALVLSQDRMLVLAYKSKNWVRRLRTSPSSEDRCLLIMYYFSIHTYSHVYTCEKMSSRFSSCFIDWVPIKLQAWMDSNHNVFSAFVHAAWILAPSLLEL